MLGMCISYFTSVKITVIVSLCILQSLLNHNLHELLRIHIHVSGHTNMSGMSIDSELLYRSRVIKITVQLKDRFFPLILDVFCSRTKQNVKLLPFIKNISVKKKDSYTFRDGLTNGPTGPRPRGPWAQGAPKPEPPRVTSLLLTLYWYDTSRPRGPWFLNPSMIHMLTNGCPGL